MCRSDIRRGPIRSRSIDFALDIRPGENVAFVGPSGAGKSTTFQLLLRFYDPRVRPRRDRRRRTSPGRRPKPCALASDSFRRRRCCSARAPAKTSATAGPAATDAEIEAAARAAGADAFIRQLPEGYDTFLGERGARLSGGQRQRIAIARALLKDPPILLLDEATSSLDAESERYVQEALEQLMEHRTTIIIAHRLATILKADRIVVLDHGRIMRDRHARGTAGEQRTVRATGGAAVRGSVRLTARHHKEHKDRIAAKDRERIREWTVRASRSNSQPSVPLCAFFLFFVATPLPTLAFVGAPPRWLPPSMMMNSPVTRSAPSSNHRPRRDVFGRARSL